MRRCTQTQEPTLIRCRRMHLLMPTMFPTRTGYQPVNTMISVQMLIENLTFFVLLFRVVSRVGPGSCLSLSKWSCRFLCMQNFFATTDTYISPGNAESIELIKSSKMNNCESISHAYFATRTITRSCEYLDLVNLFSELNQALKTNVGPVPGSGFKMRPVTTCLPARCRA